MTPEIPDISLQKEQFLEHLGGAAGGLQAFLEEVHPADLAEWLLDLNHEESWRVFEGLDSEVRAEVLAHAGERDPVAAVSDLTL